MFRFDHLAIACAGLADGRSWSKQVFGAAFPDGGSHPRMGTHNLLSACADDAFVEIIAVDASATPPERPRWFGLDDLYVRDRLDCGPSLEGWAAGVADIEAALQAVRAAGVDLGRPVEITRGDLRWLISIRDDGALPEFGWLPFLIQWPYNVDGSTPHPAAGMKDQGLRVESLVLGHPDPDRMVDILVALGGLTHDQSLDIRWTQTSAERAGVSAHVRRADGQLVRLARR